MSFHFDLMSFHFDLKKPFSVAMAEEAALPNRLNPIAKTLLEGIYDESCDLSKIRGIWHILSQIWRHVTDYWKSNIEFSSCSVDDLGRTYPELAFLKLDGITSCEVDGEVVILSRNLSISRDALVFPKSSGIQINMMPFVMDRKTFSACLLPKYLKEYWKNIIRKCPLESEQIGKIGYLTIQESFVEKDTSHRRPGLHTERPGVIRIKMEPEKDDSQGAASADGNISDETKDSGDFGVGQFFLRRYSFGWGLGGMLHNYESTIEGGIYMASNVKDSCRIYKCKIMNDDLIGEHGDIEHLRDFLPEGEILQENALYWFTDRTPHESLPLKTGTNRQFFRLVTSDVSVWYEDHSTKNPLGVVPDPEKTKIIKGSKFDKAGVVFSEEQSSPAKKRGLKHRLKQLFSK